MVNVKKKYRIILIMLVLILFTAIFLLVYFNMNKKRDNYRDIFINNKNVFTELSSDLMQLEQEIKIEKNSNKIIIFENGNTIDISNSALSEITKTNINNIINNLGISSIQKTSSNIKFIFKSKKDEYSVVYSINNMELANYTTVEDLGGNWYYCFILHE